MSSKLKYSTSFSLSLSSCFLQDDHLYGIPFYKAATHLFFVSCSGFNILTWSLNGSCLDHLEFDPTQNWHDINMTWWPILPTLLAKPLNRVTELRVGRKLKNWIEFILAWFLWHSISFNFCLHRSNQIEPRTNYYPKILENVEVVDLRYFDKEKNVMICVTSHIASETIP